jgi:hypothetical protein
MHAAGRLGRQHRDRVFSNMLTHRTSLWSGREALPTLSSTLRSAIRRIPGDGRFDWVLLLFLGLPALGPFLSDGLPRAQDSIMHLMRLGALDYQVRQGMLYPRWVPELMLGRGYPVFNFYGPLTYYLAEALHLTGFSYYVSFTLAFVLLVFAAGAGMWLLARDVFGPSCRWAALITAVAYLYAPYLLTNVFIRGALAEVGAQAALPWILWSVRRLMCSGSPAYYLPAVALSIGALAVTHNITLIFAPAFVLGYIAVLWLKCGSRVSKPAWVVLALLAAMGVSAFFWLPLVGERGYLTESAYQISRAVSLPANVWRWDNFLNLGLAFRYSTTVPFQLGTVQLSLAVAGFLLAGPPMIALLPPGPPAPVAQATGRPGSNGATMRRRFRDRWNAEWLYFGAAALVAGLGISAWTLPVWLSSTTLQIIQFPWRLLSVMSLSLALLTGGIVLRIRPRWWRAAVALAVIAAVMLANKPRLEQVKVLSAANTQPTLPVIAQLELETGVLGASGIQEFKPRWVGDPVKLVPTADQPGGQVSLSLSAGNAYDLEAQVTSTDGGPLRFDSFYFPGWRVVLDHHLSLKTYPSTSLGLLTVDLPPGIHELRLSWVGTALQRVATVVSLVTLAALAWVWWREGSRNVFLRGSHRQGGAARAGAVVLMAFIALGALAFWLRPRLTTLDLPTGAVEAGGVQLLGYYVELGDPGYIYLYPYWYVASPKRDGSSGEDPGDLRARWQIQDAAGHILTETTARPFFNTLEASAWPTGTLVRDAYRLSLPPVGSLSGVSGLSSPEAEGLAAGTYQLAVRLGQSEEELARDPIPIGSLTLPTASPEQGPGRGGGTWWDAAFAQRTPANTLDMRLGDAIRLAGFDLVLAGKPVISSADHPRSLPSPETPSGLREEDGPQPGSAPAVALPGQALDLTLYWQALGPVAMNYHGFAHLVDNTGRSLVQQDQLPGPYFRPPMLWDRYHLQPDSYHLRIPKDAPSGLYWPTVGLYDMGTRERLPVSNAAEKPLGDAVRLSPLKVVNRSPRLPGHRVAARFGNVATLLGYDLTMLGSQPRAGQPFTLTLCYRSETATQLDLTRFVHLYRPASGMAAQNDSLPAGGENPTWAWIPGEVICEDVALSVAPDAEPGRYVLSMGFYDARADGQAQRLPVFDDDHDEPLPDAQMILTEVDIQR